MTAKTAMRFRPRALRTFAAGLVIYLLGGCGGDDNSSLDGSAPSDASAGDASDETSHPPTDSGAASHDATAVGADATGGTAPDATTSPDAMTSTDATT